MDRGKNYVYLTAYLILLIIFITFRVFELTRHYNNPTNSTKGKISIYIKKNKHIDGIIYGGSNAAFGISAEILSNFSKKNFYNLSLINEGIEQINFYDYLNESLDDSIKNNINVVLFSTIGFYQKKPIDRNKKENYSLLPKQSIISYFINNIIYSNNSYPYNCTAFGDYIHSNVKQRYNKTAFLHPNIRTMIVAILKEKKYLKEIFPNSKFIILIPPIYNLQQYKEQEIYMRMLTSELDKSHVSYIVENPINDYAKNWFDDRHLNENGRQIRTKNLYSKLEKLDSLYLKY
jgi:hypothetical protein